MFKSEEPFSPEITPEQFEEFESKIKEYFLLSQMIRKTESEIFEVGAKGVKDLHEAVKINEEGIKLVEQLAVLKAE
jgi:hypothetical protein